MTSGKSPHGRPKLPPPQSRRHGNNVSQPNSAGARRLPAPPSTTSELADRIPVVDAVVSFLRAIPRETQTAFKLLKWHAIAGLICAFGAASVDFALYTGSVQPGISLPPAMGWDGAFLTIILFIAVDAGLKLSLAMHRKFDQVSPLVGSAQYFATATSLIFPVLLPSGLRFVTAVPAGYFGEGMMPYFFIKFLFLYIAIASLGGIASLISAGFLEGAGTRISRAVWMLIPIAAFTGFVSPLDLGFGSIPTRFLLSFSMGGILTLGNPESALFSVDITLPPEIKLAFAVIVSLFTCLFSYVFTSMAIGAVCLIAQFTPRRIANSAVFSALPVASASAMAAVVGVYALVGEDMIFGARHPSESTAFFPMPGLVLTGFGLALATSYLHSKTESQMGYYGKNGTPTDGMSLENVQFSAFLPFFTFVAAIGALNLSPVIDLVTLLIAWTISFVAGAAVVKLLHVTVSPAKRTLATPVCAGFFIAICTLGAYGTPTSGNAFWRNFNPYETAAGLLGQIAELSSAEKAYYIILIVLAWIAASNLDNLAAARKRRRELEIAKRT